MNDINSEVVGYCEGCGFPVYEDEDYWESDEGFMFCEECCDREC